MRRCLQKGSCDRFALLSKDVSSLDPHGAMSFCALRGVANSSPCRLHGEVLLESIIPKKVDHVGKPRMTKPGPNQISLANVPVSRLENTAIEPKDFLTNDQTHNDHKKRGQACLTRVAPAISSP